MKNTTWCVSFLIASTLLTASAVMAQPQQWVEMPQAENGTRTFFDLKSQGRQFQAGVKEVQFNVQTLSSSGVVRKGYTYRADCFRSTLQLLYLELLASQDASVIEEIPLDREDRQPFTPNEGTVLQSVWQYACSQF